MFRYLILSILLLSSLYFHGQKKGEYVEFKYENGEISSAGYLLDGKPEGFWKTFYLNGSIKSEGNRTNFKLDSTWTFFTEEGLLKEKIEYENGKRNGLTLRYKDQQLIEECNYENDTIQGLCKEYQDEKLRREIPFQNGKQEGKGYTFDSSGQIKEILYFKAGFLRNSERINRTDKLNRKQGPWKNYYDDRTLKTEGVYVDDEKNGLFKYYNTLGEIERVEKFENGLLDDEAAETTVVDIKNSYYPSGKVKSTGAYKEGVKHGVHRDYDEDGVIIASRIYSYGKEVGSGIIGKTGQFEGPWQELYENGEIREEGTYTDGLKSGKWNYYYADGALSQRGSFRKGKAHGEWTWLYENAELRRKENYRNGREDGESIEYDVDGEVVSKGSYIDGLKEGPWYYRIGDHTIQGSYVQGEKDGKWRGLYDNGKTQFRGEFQRGFATGKHRFYFATGQLMQDGKYSSGRKDGDWRRFDENGEIILRSSFESGIERRLEGIKILPTFEDLEIY